MSPFECLECGAPAEIQGGHFMEATGFDGGDERLWVDRILCVAGHRYCLVDEERTLKL